MTNEEIRRIALEQSAEDFGCAAEAFLGTEYTLTRSRENPRARAYLPLPLGLDMVSYGSCVVAQTSQELEHVARAYLQKYPPSHCFETPHLHALDGMLAPYGLRVLYGGVFPAGCGGGEAAALRL